MIDIEITNQIASSLEDIIDATGFGYEVWTDEDDATQIYATINGCPNMLEIDITHFEFTDTDDDDDIYAIAVHAIIIQKGTSTKVTVEDVNERGLAFALIAAAR